MSGLLKLLRASLLGACLCIAAAQLPHVQSGGFGVVTQLDLADSVSTRSVVQLAHSSMLAPLGAPAQWIASGSHPDMPFDSQPLGDLGGVDVDSDADDVDDFDDALSHVHLGLFCLDFGVAPQQRTVHREREHLRREDRRCDKPPRSRHT